MSAAGWIALCGLLLGMWAACLSVRARRLTRRVRHLHRRLREERLIAAARRKLQEGQWQLEQAVDQSTSSVEAIHRAVADLSFDLWGVEAERARELHHSTADQIYGSIRLANRFTGRLLARLLGTDEDRDR